MSNIAAPSLEEISAEVHQPTWPYDLQWLEIIQHADDDLAVFTAVLESEPVMASRILRLVNSPCFDFPCKITCLQSAIHHVGVPVFKNLALCSTILTWSADRMCGLLNLNRLCQDSLRRALFARGLGKVLGVDDTERVFTSALLQDMALPWLVQKRPVAYHELLGGLENGVLRLSILERERFGWTHAEVGAQLARDWNLADGIAESIELHVALDDLLTDGTTDAGLLAVSLSALLPAACELFWHEREKFETTYHYLCANGPELPELLEQVDRDFAHFASSLQMAIPARSLGEMLDSDAVVALK